MGSVKVIGLPASTNVARVLTCLIEKDVNFQLIRTDIYKGDHVVPEFLKLQDPSGHVIFEKGKKSLRDSREICRYVCDKYADQGNKSLLGTGTLERASIEQWLQAEAQSFDPPSSALVFHLAFAPALNMKPDEALIEQCEKKLSTVLDIYEDKLGLTKYLAGDEFSLADLSHLPNLQYLANNQRGRSLITSKDNVNRWWKLISFQQSWKKVAKMQGEHPHPLEK